MPMNHAHPIPDFNVLKILHRHAQAGDAPAISSPVGAFSGSADLCPGKSKTTPARPVSVAAAVDYVVMP